MRRIVPPSIGIAALVVVAWWTPFDASALARRSDVALWWAYASSVLFAAAPFVTGGALLTHAARGRALPSPALAVFALACPACECSGAALAALFSRLHPATAAAGMTWAALCNLPAMIATWSARGPSAAIARGIAGAASALAAALVVGRGRHLHVQRCAGVYDASDGLGAAILGVAITAAICGCVAAWAPQLRGGAADPLRAALAGALLAPCATTDAVVARLVAGAPAADLIFAIGAQTLSVRHLFAMRRAFGFRGALAACIGAACAVAVALVVR